MSTLDIKRAVAGALFAMCVFTWATSTRAEVLIELSDALRQAFQKTKQARDDLAYVEQAMKDIQQHKTPQALPVRRAAAPPFIPAATSSQAAACSLRKPVGCSSPAAA
jgi:hypothetical protein